MSSTSGNWKKSIPSASNLKFAFDQETNQDPHRERRRIILQKYPQLRALFAYDPSTVLIAALCSSCQVLLAWHLKEASWLFIVLCAGVLGATLSQLAGEIIHECAHNLAASSSKRNKLVGILANFTVPFPISVSFAKYHLMHHAFQGIPKKDPDLPLEAEIWLVRGNWLAKLLWLLFYPVMYVFRGALFFQGLSQWELGNILAIVLYDALVIWKFSLKAFWYLVLSLWIGYSIHPAAAHFIQEHYTFVDGQETYSYYGPLNWLFINIGYHNEHHDFPRVPWSSLKQVNKEANEFYSGLFAHNSWLKVFWSFIFNPCIGPQSRVIRQGVGEKSQADKPLHIE